MNLNELKTLYVEAIKAYIDSLKYLDDFDLQNIEEPSVMLLVENPQPIDGTEIDIMPGLKGYVSHSSVEINKKEKIVTSFVKVKCSDIEKFLEGIGMKIKKDVH